MSDDPGAPRRAAVPGTEDGTDMATTVLVRGVGTHNGGAELLLRAVVEELGPGRRAVVDVRRVGEDLRDRWGTGRYVSVPRLGPLESLGLAALPRAVADRAGWWSSRHVDAVLDASGFAYGDQWHAGAIGRAGGFFARWRRRGVPVVLLPQAFGPFRDPVVREACRRTLSQANLLYARDEVSRDHLADLLPGATVGLCPDITVALHADPDPGTPAGSVALVPNENISRRSDRPDARAAYAAAVAATAEQLRAAGLRPFLLRHSRPDEVVVAAVAALDPALPVVRPADGLEAKAVIAACTGVVGARYHALVSALSSGVPVVAHSWSHKYQALLDDFGVGGVMADPFDGPGSASALEELVRGDLREDLLTARARLQERVDGLWAAVGAVL